MSLASDVITKLQGKTLATAESCTGGGIGATLTAVPGASKVYKGGVISYCNEIKERALCVSSEVLSAYGAVSAPVAEAMAVGVRELLRADVAVAVTGLAGPSGDAFGNEVGTVFIGYADDRGVSAGEYHFVGDREAVRAQTIEMALQVILKHA